MGPLVGLIVDSAMAAAGTGYGEVAWDTKVVNQHGEVNAAYDVLTMVANTPGMNGAPEAGSGG